MPILNLQRWLSTLVSRAVSTASAAPPLSGISGSPPTRSVRGENGTVIAAATPVSQALQTLVGQPVGHRPPIELPRDWLDTYHRNETFYLSPDVHTLADPRQTQASEWRPMSAS